MKLFQLALLAALLPVLAGGEVRVQGEWCGKGFEATVGGVPCVVTAGHLLGSRETPQFFREDGTRLEVLRFLICRTCDLALIPVAGEAPGEVPHWDSLPKRGELRLLPEAVRPGQSGRCCRSGEQYGIALGRRHEKDGSTSYLYLLWEAPADRGVPLEFIEVPASQLKETVERSLPVWEYRNR